jgi:hypothetical protein
MVTQHTPTLGRPPRVHGRQLGAVVAGIGLAVILAIGLLVWQSGREDEQPAPPEPDTPVAAAGQGPATPGLEPEWVTVYLVPSVEEAAAIEQQVRAFLRKREGIETDGSFLALPAGTAEERARAGVVVRVLRLDLGDDRLRVVDLRALPAATERVGTTGISELDGARAAAGRNPTSCADGGAGDPTLVRDTCP